MCFLSVLLFPAWLRVAGKSKNSVASHSHNILDIQRKRLIISPALRPWSCVCFTNVTRSLSQFQNSSFDLEVWSPFEDLYCILTIQIERRQCRLMWMRPECWPMSLVRQWLRWEGRWKTTTEGCSRYISVFHILWYSMSSTLVNLAKWRHYMFVTMRATEKDWADWGKQKESVIMLWTKTKRQDENEQKWRNRRQPLFLAMPYFFFPKRNLENSEDAIAIWTH